MRKLSAFILASLVLAGSTAVTSARDDVGKEEFSAVALSPGGTITPPVTGQLQIVIERWSTGAHQKRLMAALNKGQSEMLEAMRALPRVGYIRTPNSLAWDLHYAQQQRGEDGGRKIILGTDRPISVWEAINQPRSYDYPFTFIELNVNNDGEGKGHLTPATRVTSDGKFVHLTNYDHAIPLTQVKKK
jgi:hypothetical protein